MGYDDLETLVEIKSEDLNHLMMRAYQQDILLDALKKYSEENEIELTVQTKNLEIKPASFKATTRPHSAMTTNPSSSPSSSRLRTSYGQS
jgi:hypothetical protein